MNLIGEFQNIINEYLNYFFVISDTSVYNYVVKFVIFLASSLINKSHSINLHQHKENFNTNKLKTSLTRKTKFQHTQKQNKNKNPDRFFTSPCTPHTAPWGRPGCKASHICSTFNTKNKTKPINVPIKNPTKSIKEHIFIKLHKAKTKNNKHSHSYTVRCESPSSSLVLESTIIILSPNILKLRIVLKRVNSALPFYSVSTLNIIMVRKKQLLSSMELSPTSDRFLRPIVPPHSNLHVVPIVSLDLLDACHVRRLTCVRWSHQYTIPSCPKHQKSKICQKTKNKEKIFIFLKTPNEKKRHFLWWVVVKVCTNLWQLWWCLWWCRLPSLFSQV